MSVADRVRDLVLPLLDDRHLDLYDVEMQGPVLRVVVDNPPGSGGGGGGACAPPRAPARLARGLRVVVYTPPGSGGGLALDVLADATRAVSRALDEADPITGRYTLEV